MAIELDNYLVQRLNAFDEKLDKVLNRMEQKIDDHAKEDRENLLRIDGRLFEMNGAMSGLRVKSSVFGIAGGAVAAFLIWVRSHL
jgi:hypothetical protein